MSNLDLNDKPITWGQVSWLLDRGVPPNLMPSMARLRVIDEAIAFYEEASDDLVLWRPRSGSLASVEGRAFALGEDNIGNAATYAFDTYLAIHSDPLDWLRDSARGIVVLRWDIAFDMLRDAPRIAVAEDVLPLYRKAMKPAVLPDLYVMGVAA